MIYNKEREHLANFHNFKLYHKFFFIVDICGLYYKAMTIVNDDSRAVNKLEASLTDDARFAIYYHHMFIVQATEQSQLESFSLASSSC